MRFDENSKERRAALKAPSSREAAAYAWRCFRGGNSFYFSSQKKSGAAIEQAHRHYLQAAELFEAQKDDFRGGKALRMLSIVAGMLGRAEEANTAARRAAERFERRIRASGASSAAGREAEKWLVKALRDLSENSPDPDERLRCSRRGIAIARRLKSKEPANSEWDRYRALLYRAAAGALCHQTARTRRGLRRALTCLRKAIEILDEPGFAVSAAQISKAKAYRERSRVLRALEARGASPGPDGHAAEAAVREAIRIFRRHHRESQWNHYHLAKVLLHHGKWDEALEECRKAAEILEADREKHERDDNRITFFGDNMAVYDLAVYLCHLLDRPEQGLSFAQRCKSRVFLERLGGRKGPEGRRTEPTVSAGELRTRLKKGEALLEYHVGRHQLTSFIVTKGGFSSGRVPLPAEELETLVRAFHGLVNTHRESPSSSAYRDMILEDLGRRLLPSRLDAFDGIGRLHVVPSGPLFMLPFGALVLPDGKPLLAKCEVCHLPHAASLPARRRKAPVRKLLALGNPSGELWEAEQEVREIGALLPKASVLVGDQAAKTALKMRGVSHLHFACHGDFRAEDPLASALQLAPRAKDDGRLSLPDIYRLKLGGVDLAFLSCCDTGLGRLWKGDEVEGVSRAFLCAGAKSVVVTLWDVEEAATRKLATAFYGCLKRGASKAAALRRAKLELRKSHPHPYYWAGFQLVGSP